MATIVYVEAITRDADIKNEMYRLFRQLVRAKPDISGFSEMYPVTTQFMLNALSSRRPEFADSIQPLEGIGIWTEWADSESVKQFFRSPIHERFVGYAESTFGKARYRIVQLIDGRVKIRNLPDEQSYGSHLP